ncbi:MAG: hypothetical protein KC496_13745, partial [Anaerolineae bacterium]|nr:hypothetical protein [Anaerolineae bacterium]
MDASTIAYYTGLSEELVAEYLRLSAQEIYSDPQYIKALYALDKKYLRNTLGMVRDFYEAHLSEFADNLENRYHISRGSMSGFTLGNWVVGFLDYPEYAADLLKKHTNLPAEVFHGGLEDLLGLMDGL